MMIDWEVPRYVDSDLQLSFFPSTERSKAWEVYPFELYPRDNPNSDDDDDDGDDESLMIDHRRLVMMIIDDDNYAFMNVQIFSRQFDILAQR